eukprot:m.16073 g.16073  ORF g.16073 m.16073 type:complete len:622 (+) comp26727_c0_seq1:100-1965(+)
MAVPGGIETQQASPWYSSLNLSDVRWGKADSSHSTTHVLRHDATWMGEQVTATKMPISEEGLRWLVATMQSIRHPNLLLFLGFVFSPNDPYLPHIITEHMGEDLKQLLLRMPELSFRVSVNGLKQIARGLCYLHHSKGIAHGCLVPQNVITKANGMVMKIAYFGFAKLGLTLTCDDTAGKKRDVELYGILTHVMLDGSLQKWIDDGVRKDLVANLKGLLEKCKLPPKKLPSAADLIDLLPALPESEPTPAQPGPNSRNLERLQFKVDQAESTEQKLRKEIQDLKDVVATQKTSLEQKREVEDRCKSMEELAEQMNHSHRREMARLAQKDQFELAKSRSIISEMEKQASANNQSLKTALRFIESYQRNSEKFVAEMRENQDGKMSGFPQGRQEVQFQSRTLPPAPLERLPWRPHPPQNQQGQNTAEKIWHACRSCLSLQPRNPVYVRVPETSTIVVLSDYNKSAKEVGKIMEGVLDNCGKSEEVKVKYYTRKKFEERKQKIWETEATCVFAVPVSERYIINDPQDPRSGFYKEIQFLGQKKTIIVAFCNNDSEVDANYYSKMNRLWARESRQASLKEFAEKGRFYSVKEGSSMKPWQLVSLAAALGFLPKEKEKKKDGKKWW